MSRKGCKDCWNAFMYKGAVYSPNDIPYCPTTATRLPKDIITWREAITIYNKRRRKNKNFHYPAFVCWYEDDYKFDGKGGIWNRYRHLLNVVRHFDGIITPDFSTFQDFPYPLKIYNTSRMRALGLWLANKGILVINNVRWGTAETYKYCFDGIAENSIIAIGTVGGSPRKIKDRYRFEQGLFACVEVLKPHTIIVYGSANYPCFDILRKSGIRIVSYLGKTAKAHARGKSNE